MKFCILHYQSRSITLNLNWVSTPQKTLPSNPDSFLENLWVIDRKHPFLNFREIWVTWYRDVWPALLRRLSRQNIHSIIYGRPESFSRHSFTSKTNRYLISQSKTNCNQLSLLIPNLSHKTARLERKNKLWNRDNQNIRPHPWLTYPLGLLARPWRLSFCLYPSL